MAKDKSTKKEAKPVSNGVKSGRVTKPEQKKAKVDVKIPEKKEGKKSKAKKEPTPEPESESEEENTSDSSVSSDSEDESEAEVKPKAKTNGAKKAAESSDEDESSDESSDDEDDKKATVGDVSMADADSDEESEEDSDGSDSSEGDDSSDEEEESDEAPAKVEETGKKRKADSEVDTSAKRFKANGEPCAEPSKQLFVGSLSWNVDEEWLAREFEGFGEIVGARIMTRPEDGKSKGFGFVEFADVESAVKALDAKQGAEVDGRNLNLDFSTPRPDRSYNNDQVNARASKFGDKGSGNPPSATLFVGNLSFNATQELVGETFQEHGSVVGVRLPTDRETGELKGFAYVEFGSIEEAQAAHAALNGADIAGRNVRLDFAGARPTDGGNRGGRGGRGGFNDRGRGGRGGGRGGRGGARGGCGGFSSTNRGGFGDFQGKKVTF